MSNLLQFITSRSSRRLLLFSLLAISSSAIAGSVAYTYDQTGRLTTALYDNNTCIAYSYDANGNRTSQTTSVGGTPVSAVWGSGVWGCFKWTP
ncbi:MAG: hypothetical protein E5X33_29710 [Mesorhizobium sp.]|uniref:RHS repeat domain-containing protein n=1 Tax=Mesorhizobium sp. TaxID=1871066 RepID=UPI001229809E|nr:RHS repeat domain-containing protein [Mesorhizobium sp.]TIR16165.1 MAG: hypothetical protein E5X33_29710 [Mesorhizobium sp.]